MQNINLEKRETIDRFEKAIDGFKFQKATIEEVKTALGIADEEGEAIWKEPNRVLVYYLGEIDRRSDGKINAETQGYVFRFSPNLFGGWKLSVIYRNFVDRSFKQEDFNKKFKALNFGKTTIEEAIKVFGLPYMQHSGYFYFRDDKGESIKTKRGDKVYVYTNFSYDRCALLFDKKRILIDAVCL
jgi:hypothetical protein